MTSFNPIRFFAVLFALTFLPGANAAPDCTYWAQGNLFWDEADLADVTHCLSAGANIEARNRLGMTPLMHAALQPGWSAYRGMDISKFGLVKAEAAKEHQVADRFQAEMAKIMLDAGADPNSRDQYGLTPLLHAVGSSNAAMIKALLDAGVDPDQKHHLLSISQEAYVDFALCMAVRGGTGSWQAKEAVKALLDGGANPNVLCFFYEGTNTPLHSVAGNGRGFSIETVKLLLDAGADPNARNKNGSTPLHDAYMASPDQAGRVWEQEQVRKPEPYSWTDIYDPEIIKVLLDAGADPNVENKWGRLPKDNLN